MQESEKPMVPFPPSFLDCFAQTNKGGFCCASACIMCVLCMSLACFGLALRLGTDKGLPFFCGAKAREGRFSQAHTQHCQKGL